MTEKKRVRVTMPLQQFLVIEHEADLAKMSMNQYICKVLNKRKVVINPAIQELYMQLYLIRMELERLQVCTNSTERSTLIRKVNELCRFCDTFLVNTIKNIN